ncbi:hypothetical protein P152DRAFT_459808 [Eremomyces bilateralis CBS 781.70]|uniref:LicD/FKTN/FKRP nucleotidyltransferase domain-containing protein n=1 Tax=Eremomyces bilateralis CBS 781.70 TaxID=1392243 RepID=A0A6G1FZE0_9PEZI|nr:uncharacterized protein P152DRAFT_459808 [Eremomyces bilateralis CBS 781.70]KAF1810929.1 hypothetical protein P152DRAFT_459808 [Eremomyces bilateralis CBS 781.70]
MTDVDQMLPWDTDIDTQVSVQTLERLGSEYNQTLHRYDDSVSTSRWMRRAVQRDYFLDVNSWIGERTYGDGQNVIDARWIDVRNGLFIDITGLTETAPERNPGMVQCKNNHFYRVEDLFPLTETTFEGVTALVPNNSARALTEEYGEQSLVLEQFNG